jgi:hypothetical protein
MSSDGAKLSHKQKLKALRKIQFACGQTARPVARACGLSQEELEGLANEQLIELYFVADEGPDLDRYHISTITPAGMAVLTEAHVEPDPLKISIEPVHKSVWKRIFQATRSGLWDLIKVAFGAVLGWLLKKYFG